MARVKKGDVVAVLSGKDRGKTGKVLRVWPAANRALVERVNLMKHFERRSQQHPSGGVVEREGSLPMDKLAPVCPGCRKPGRVGFRIAGDVKQRVCRRCNEVLA